VDTIIIQDLEVFYRVGVPDAERAQPQRLLITLELGLDFEPAAVADDLDKTIDYDALCRRLSAFGDDRGWKLIETLALAIADITITEFGARQVTVEVKKFILPNTRYVAVRVIRSRGE